MLGNNKTSNIHSRLWLLEVSVVFFGVYAFFLESTSNNITLATATRPILLALLIAYILINYFFAGVRSARKDHILLGILFVIIAILIGSSVLTQIELRLGNQPWEYVHDHPLQMESAVEFLLDGKNPYQEDYTETSLAKWKWTDPNENPAIYHVIALPFTIIKSVPFFVIWNNVWGWYDDRISHLAMFVLSIIALYYLFDTQEYKRLAIIIFALNPWFYIYFIKGMNDIIFLSLLFSSLALLKNKWVTWSVVFLALAISTKHTAWLILPFYISYLWYSGGLKINWRKPLLVFSVITAILIAPFIIWDWHAFYEDVYQYPAGSIATSYPIKGPTLVNFLIELKVINDGTNFPFKILQIALLPLIWVLVLKQRKNNRLSIVLFNYGILLWLFWLFSRFMNPNYISVLLIIFSLAALLYAEELHLKEHPAVNQAKTS